MTNRCTLKIPFGENADKVFEAERLLNEAGVEFDTGTDGATRDWELDWSLKGATLDCSVKPRKIRK